MSRNECIRCVRAPGRALDHFWWMRDLTLRFWAKMAKTCGRNTRKRAYRSAAPEVGRWAPTSRRSAPELALLHLLGARRPGQDNGNAVPCPGAWGQSRRGPMRPFWGVLLLFSLTFLLEHIWLCWNLDFPNGLKPVNVSFQFFGFCRKVNFCELKGLQAWSTDHIDLDKACKDGLMS